MSDVGTVGGDVRPVRLLHIISGLGLGGAETMLVRLVAHLDPAAFASSVVSMTTEGELGHRLRALGIPLTSLGMLRGLPNPLGLIRLVRLMRCARPDLVQTWMYHADLLGGLAARMAGRIPVVWGIRHTDLRRGSDRWTTRITARLNARLSDWLPTKIICNSEASRRVHERLGYAPSRLAVIPNGFDTSRFRPDALGREQLRQELDLAPETLVVGHMGRYHPQKDHRTFLKAIARLRPRLGRMVCLLAGEGVTEENLELSRLIRELNLRPAVRLMGILEDPWRLYPALDVFCLSSSHGESFPQVVGEAMACGVPCVVTDVGDAAVIVGPAGKAVPPEDAHALACALEELLTESAAERRRLGEVARERIRRHFSLESTVARYASVYVDIACPATQPDDP